MKGKRWTREDKDMLREGVRRGMYVEEIQATYFPDRSLKAILGILDRQGLEARRRAKPREGWKKSEIERLRQLMHEADLSSWEDVARRMPGRTVDSCKYAARKYIPLQEGRRHHIRADNHVLRKVGPPPPWMPWVGKELSAIVKKGGHTATSIHESTGLARYTIGLVLKGHRACNLKPFVAICLAVGADPGHVLGEGVRKSLAHRGKRSLLESDGED